MHKINIQFYGSLTEITGTRNLTIEDANDTDKMQEIVNALFPKIRKENYLLAVNNSLIKHNTQLEASSTVAYMPPFSGG